MHPLVLLVSMGSAATGDIVLHGPGLCAVGLVWGTTTAKVCIDIQGFWYHQRQCWFQGSATPPVAMFVSMSITARGTMPTQVVYEATWARTRFLPKAMSKFVDQEQPGSWQISMAHIITGAIVPMHVESEGCAEPALSHIGFGISVPAPHGTLQRESCHCPPIGQVASAVRRGGPTPHHWCGRAGSKGKGLGEMAIPHDWGVVPMTETCNLSYHPDPYPGYWVGSH